MAEMVFSHQPALGICPLPRVHVAGLTTGPFLKGLAVLQGSYHPAPLRAIGNRLLGY
jgi:hypothetical protein